jgi:hypothetical protein
VVFVAEHLANELDAVLFDPQQGDLPASHLEIRPRGAPLSRACRAARGCDPGEPELFHSPPARVARGRARPRTHVGPRGTVPSTGIRSIEVPGFSRPTN